MYLGTLQATSFPRHEVAEPEPQCSRKGESGVACAHIDLIATSRALTHKAELLDEHARTSYSVRSARFWPIRILLCLLSL